jgi:DNA-binding Lrp family transcriptional regulator
MDTMDRQIINALQGGFPVCETPFAEAAARLRITEDDLIARVRRLCDEGQLSRFGPMYNAERLGGAVTLAAMAVPAEQLEAVAAQVNAHPEVAHNYARTHDFNMWFVVAAEQPERIPAVLADIAAETGLPVYDMPKLDEYYVGLRFEL